MNNPAHMLYQFITSNAILRLAQAIPMHKAGQSALQVPALGPLLCDRVPQLPPSREGGAQTL